MKQILRIILLFIIASNFTYQSFSSIIRVPGQVQKIQEAINLAKNGDTVLVSHGVYPENILIENKEIVLASNFIFSGDKKDIYSTILNGNKGDFVIKISNTNPNTSIAGFTIEDGDDGVSAGGKFNFQNNIVRHCSDGVDYESKSGGLCQNNIFELNSDDGIDLDDDVEIIIEKNIIRCNRDDGIEIRMQPYSGITLNYEIKNNLIINNGEDGIQLIGYPEKSPRVITIRNNVIANISMAAIGCMADGKTKENFEAAPLTERIYIYNNTILNCSYGICGGGNSILLNNSISNIQNCALKGIGQKSIVAHQNVFLAKTLFEKCNVFESTITNVNPMLNDDYSLSDQSMLIARGVSEFTYNDLQLTIEGNRHRKSTDIGALESGLSNWLGTIGPRGK